MSVSGIVAVSAGEMLLKGQDPLMKLIGQTIRAKSNKGGEQLMKEVDTIYRNEINNALWKQEELMLVSDLLGHAEASEVDARKDFVKAASEKAMVQVAGYVLYRLREKLVPFHLSKSEWCLRQGRAEDALNSLEEALEVAPDMRYHLSKVCESSSQERTGTIADELRKRYRFQYEGSFGHRRIKAPFDAVATKDARRLFVTDYIANKVVVFCDEKYAGDLVGDLKAPMGLCRDDNDSVYICDFGNKRLLIVSSAGIVLDEIGLEGINPKACHPRSVGLTSGEIFILMSDGEGECREIVCLDRFGAGDHKKHLKVEGLGPMICLRIHDDDLYVGNFAPPLICKYASREGRPVKWLKPNVPGSLRRFTTLEDSLIISTGRHIAKANADGQIQFSFNMARFFGTEKVMARGLEVAEGEGDVRLLVADELQMSIHKFLI